MEILFLFLAMGFGLIAWMNLSSAFLILLTLLPSYLLRIDLFGFPTTLLEVLFVVLVGVWIAKNHLRLQELLSLQKNWALAIALIVISATISAIIAPNTIQAFGIWKAYFIEPIFFFYLLKDALINTKITSQQISRALLMSGVWISLVALAQWILSAGIPIPWDIERRVTSIFDYPNALGLYLGPLAVIAFLQLSKDLVIIKIKQHLTKDAWITLGCFILFVIVIILAKSEGALAALFITIFLAGIIQPIWRKKTILLTSLFIFIGLIVPFSRTYLIEKLTFQDYSQQVRLTQWSETWELIKDHSILGVGLSGYPQALVPYHQAMHIEIFQYPHNIFFNIWVELGLLGLIAFIFLAITLVRPFPLSFLPLLPLLQMFLHGMVDVPYFKNDLALLTWTLLAILYYEHHSKSKTHF